MPRLNMAVIASLRARVKERKGGKDPSGEFYAVLNLALRRKE